MPITTGNFPMGKKPKGIKKPSVKKTRPPKLGSKDKQPKTMLEKLIKGK